MIRGVHGQSSYYLGRFNNYGMYQWNIKYYKFESDFEIEEAILWALGQHGKNAVGYGFDYLDEIIGRPVKSHTDGRSGGWLVIDTPLTEEELQRIDDHIESHYNAMFEFLLDVRADRAEFESSQPKPKAKLTLIKGGDYA